MNNYHILYREISDSFAKGITFSALNIIEALNKYKETNNIDLVIAIYRVNDNGYLFY